MKHKSSPALKAVHYLRGLQRFVDLLNTKQKAICIKLLCEVYYLKRMNRYSGGLLILIRPINLSFGGAAIILAFNVFNCRFAVYFYDVIHVH